jgi:hypothetical protein
VRPGLRKRGSGAEPILDASGPASAAVERRKASGRRKQIRCADCVHLSAMPAAAPRACSGGDAWMCGAAIGWMRLSALRLPSFKGGLWKVFFAHDLIRKPVTTFRDHALQNSDANALREGINIAVRDVFTSPRWGEVDL